jgi:hypothetical protein
MLTACLLNTTRSKACFVPFSALLLMVLALLISPKVSANSVNSLTYDFDHTLTGVAPAGPIPWLTAVFQNSGPNSVQVTLSASGLTGTESVNQWYFNLNPAYNPANLVFTETASTGSFGAPTVLAGANAFKADHDGKYDVEFNFSSAAGATFGGGDSVTFNITGINGLNVLDFLFANTPAAGHDPLLASASVQTLGEAVIIDNPPIEGMVPEVAQTALLLGLASMAVEGCRRKLLRPGH